MTDETRLSSAEAFLYKNARLLERWRFEFHFRQERCATCWRSSSFWNITWEPISTGVACEWRGALTLGNLLLLRAWGRL